MSFPFFSEPIFCTDFRYSQLLIVSPFLIVQENGGHSMKFRKTATNKRSGYIYKFDDGKRVLIQLNKEGVTEIDIQRLHALDDSEVYYNIKNSRPNSESEWF